MTGGETTHRVLRFHPTVTWTGNEGSGTSHYRAYSRSHRISAPSKPDLEGSSDPAFRGDPSAWSPEDLLVASLSACHMLWYLHLSAEEGVVVTAYRDDPVGEMPLGPGGRGAFSRVLLRPTVTLTPGSDAETALALHEEAHAACFIAASVNFPVEWEGLIVMG